MNETQESKGANDGPAEALPNLAKLKMMLAYSKLSEGFQHAMTSLDDSLREKPEDRVQLTDAVAKLQAMAADVKPAETFAAVLIVVRGEAGPTGEMGYGLSRALVGSEPVLRRLLPLAHLTFEFELEGVLPPTLDGLDVAVETHPATATEQ